MGLYTDLIIDIESLQKQAKEYQELMDLVYEYLDDLNKGGYNSNSYIDALCKKVGFKK